MPVWAGREDLGGSGQEGPANAQQVPGAARGRALSHPLPELGSRTGNACSELGCALFPSPHTCILSPSVSEPPQQAQSVTPLGAFRSAQKPTVRQGASRAGPPLKPLRLHSLHFCPVKSHSMGKASQVDAAEGLDAARLDSEPRCWPQ